MTSPKALMDNLRASDDAHQKHVKNPLISHSQALSLTVGSP